MKAKLEEFGRAALYSPAPVVSNDNAFAESLSEWAESTAPLGFPWVFKSLDESRGYG